MWVSRLRLENFRNHTLTECVLERGVTTFVGSNGQGKTNLIEGLVYVGTGQSHRTTSDEALVHAGHNSANLAATVHVDHRSVRLGVTVNVKGSNKPTVNEAPTTVSELASWLNVVVFSPEDLAIIRQDPSHRRRFLDTAITSLTPRLASVLADYERLIKQRNTVLKSLRQGKKDSTIEHTLVVWDEKLVALSVEITQARLNFLSMLAPFFADAYDHLRPGHRVHTELLFSQQLLKSITVGDSEDTMKSHYREALHEVAEEEKERGITLLGPHRDDVGIFLNGLHTRTHSSQGEAWSSALALKLGVATLSRQQSFSGDPIIVLDDVFSELDKDRRLALADAVKDWEQVLITAAVVSDIPRSLNGHIREVREGALVDD